MLLSIFLQSLFDNKNPLVNNYQWVNFLKYKERKYKQPAYFINEIERFTKSAKSLPFNILLAKSARSINCLTLS